MKPGSRNLITDIDGLLVGNASDPGIKTGTTVLTAASPFTAAVDVMGGAPGTRETDLLDADRLVTQVDGLVLSGGSAFGLDAASGVADAMRVAGRGFEVGSAIVPIVPGAILFDLANQGDKEWAENPYKQLGAQAYAAAGSDFGLGTAGAGYGATTANLKGGLGSASIVLDSGITVGALVAVNPVGSTVTPSGHFWSGLFEIGDEYGGRGAPQEIDPLREPGNEKRERAEAPRGNTTIAIVATDATLDQSQLKRMAVAAQDGMARAIVPSHTPFDGDLVFSLSTAARELTDPVDDQMAIGHAASICLARAISRGVYLATAEPNDLFPTWQQTWA